MGIIEKIKLLFKVKGPLTEIAGEVTKIKSGYKTLTFWATILASAISLVSGLAGFIPPVAALIATTVITAAYNIVRAIQNSNVPGVDPLFQSSRFWIGILGILSNAVMQLQHGGINPEWLVTLNGILAAVMAGAQNLGAQQPGTSPAPTQSTQG